MNDVPTGTVTFLFTDIEGSTNLAQQFPDAMPALLARHHAILRQAIQAHQGIVYKTIGDAFCAAFPTANLALQAAVGAQRALQHEAWSPAPIKVRMGLHSGPAQPELEGERLVDYTGYLTLTLAQRVMSAAYGSQVLLSNSTAELVHYILPLDVSLRDMGEHRLKGLTNLERIWQVTAPDLISDFPPLHTAVSIPNNLPTQLTSFIGREKEIKEIKQALSGSRLVTLTAMGGAGKTRLSLQVAAGMIDEFKHGVWFVELASLTDPALVPQTVAAVLGLREGPGQPLLTVLADYLHAKTALIILDNCEHLIEGCARFAETILHAAPMVRILASSHEPLGIGGEATYRVPALAAPDPNHVPPPAVLTQYDAVQLFIERARAVMPSFEVNGANAAAVARLCYHLDGIPLAIELAAARVRGLKVEQIAQRLDDRFRLLTGGSRTALPRQQTLRALIDWSYDLLSEQERTLFCRLSVFEGGWAIKAAESVCANDPIEPSQVLELLLRLIDKSLILIDEQGEESRYHMLETLREYAMARLVTSGEANALRRHHAQYYLELMEQTLPYQFNRFPVEWMIRLTTEYDNLRGALEWCKTGAADSDWMLRFVWSGLWFWFLGGHLTEGYAWCVEAVTRTAAMASTVSRGRALLSAGGLAFTLGKYVEGSEYLRQSVAIAREHGERQLLAPALSYYGMVLTGLGDYTTGSKAISEALELARTLHNDWRLVFTLMMLGNNRIVSQGIEAARPTFEESLQLARTVGDPWLLSQAVYTLAVAASLIGDSATARPLFDESISLMRKVGDRWGLTYSLVGLSSEYLRGGLIHEAELLLSESMALAREIASTTGTAIVLMGYAGLAAARSNPTRAAQLIGAADGIMAAGSAHWWPTEQITHDSIVKTIRTLLDNADWDAAYAEGRGLTIEQAVELAVS